MWGVEYDPEVHRIHEIELARHLRRETGRPGIFTYRHEETGNWVVAVWLEPKRLFMELLLVVHPSAVTRDQVQFIKQWSEKKTPTLKDFARQEAARERDENRQWDDENREARKEKRWMGNQLNEVQKTHPFWDQPGLVGVGSR